MDLNVDWLHYGFVYIGLFSTTFKGQIIVVLDVPEVCSVCIVKGRLWYK